MMERDSVCGEAAKLLIRNADSCMRISRVRPALSASDVQRDSRLMVPWQPSRAFLFGVHITCSGELGDRLASCTK